MVISHYDFHDSELQNLTAAVTKCYCRLSLCCIVRVLYFCLPAWGLRVTAGKILFVLQERAIYKSLHLNVAAEMIISEGKSKSSLHDLLHGLLKKKSYQ